MHPTTRTIMAALGLAALLVCATLATVFLIFGLRLLPRVTGYEGIDVLVVALACLTLGLVWLAATGALAWLLRRSWWSVR